MLERPLKVWGWASDQAGCGHYRIGMPMWALGALGHDAMAFTELNAQPPEDLDVLVGQRIVTQERSQIWQSLASGASRTYAMVFELDDDLWNLDPDSVFAPYYCSDGVGAMIARNIEVADAVTVTTEHLAERVRVYNSNVYVLPNCIDQSLLSHERPISEQVRVGWAGGSGHEKDFAEVQKPLTSFFKRNPSIETVFVGVNHGSSVGRPQSQVIPGSSNLVEYVERFSFDVGIAPLAPNAFNRSKSDIKVLEYASVGIPAVATNHGPYASAVRHEETGLLVTNPLYWPRHLREIVFDNDLRSALSNNARQWAATRTIQANAWRWAAAYSEVLQAV